MDKLTQLRQILEEKRKIDTALILLHWDQATEQPKHAKADYGSVLSYLVGKNHGLIINDDVKNIITCLKEDDELTDIEKGILNELEEELERVEKIPKEEVEKYAQLQSASIIAWEDAKNKNDFEIFKPYLEKIIEYNKKLIKYRGYEGHPYNTLLKDYEKSLTVDDLDKFFNTLKEELIPVVKRVKEKGNPDFDFEIKAYDIAKQKKFSRFLSEYIGLDFNRAVLKESEHPFTTGFSNRDVRITTHYYLNNFLSAVFSTAHETGHAMYEQGIGDDITGTIIGDGSSMATHESQSRLYENIIARNKNFWSPIYSKLQELYPENLKDVSLDEFYRCINKSGPSLIRIQADELTYPFHIMIRYEIEKAIFEDKVEVSELPKLWNEKIKEYLGVEPTGFRDGILQDIHWSQGSFGYFPSYALGSAYASQFAHSINKVFSIDQCLLEGNIAKINEYLRENIHKYGKLKTSNELLKDISGEEFNPKYYIDYLKEKYTSLY